MYGVTNTVIFYAKQEIDTDSAKWISYQFRFTDYNCIGVPHLLLACYMFTCTKHD